MIAWTAARDQMERCPPSAWNGARDGVEYALTVRRTASTTPSITTATATGEDAIVARQAAVENALSMALHFARQGIDAPANVWAAVARARRALQLLTQSSAELKTANTPRG